MTDITPMPGLYTAIYILNGASVSIPQEAMEEVDDRENGNPRYSVYQITADAKQNLDKDTLPVFEKDVGTIGSWADISSAAIREIQYPGGRVVLETPLTAADTVRLKTGKYFAKRQIFGGLSTKITDKTIMKNVTPLGANAVRNSPTIDEFSVSLDIFLNKVNAQLVANDLTITHQKGGTAGNAITYRVINPGAPGSLSIVVTGNAIVATLAYAGSAITTTNQQLRTAINASAECMRLGVVAECDLGDEDSLATAFSLDTLVGGLDGEQFTKSTPIIITIYGDTSDNVRWEGYGYIESIDSNLTVDDVVKQSLSINGFGKLYFRDR